jgi:hypothetical protein
MLEQCESLAPKNSMHINWEKLEFEDSLVASARVFAPF